MSLDELRELAAWHTQEAATAGRDAALGETADDICRSAKREHFHRGAARKLNELADAFALLGQLTSTQS